MAIEKRCGIHLRGSIQCPYVPVYVIGWDQQTLRSDPDRPTTTRSWRRCCAAHLTRVVEESIFNSYDGQVIVSLFDPTSEKR